ncbi:MAG: hypothetical protein IIB62_10390 [Proteobacteria bacterium]|nr:hypothetical protein [Pseudomonadota bacterium]
MIGRTILAAAIVVFMATPGLAFYCPNNVKAIDAALAKNANASVKALRDEGEKLHKAGDHKGSVKKLAEAMRMLVTPM